MKKIFIFVITSLFIYFVLLPSKKPIATKNNTESEEVELLVAPLESLDLPASTSQPQNATSQPVDAAKLVETKKESNQVVTENKQKAEFRQITEDDGTYEPTPKILTGISAKIFSLFYPSDFLHSFKPQVEVKDIQSAFTNGNYPTVSMLKALGLDRPFSGYVRTNLDVPVLKINWNLKIDNNSDPAQGIFSLKVNGIEKSCDATASGSFKSISLLAEDNGAILVMSCDKSFYMQLYKTGSNHLCGSYFEKQQDGKYKSRGYVMLTREYIPK